MVLQKDAQFVRVDDRYPVQFAVGNSKLVGMFHFPLYAENVPTVLICHGLAGDKMGLHRGYERVCRLLAQKGIASLRFDYRGCGDSEGEFKEISIQSQIEDSLAAMDLIKHHPKVDSERIGIMGKSFGGLIAVQTAVNVPEVKSLVLWAPVFSGDPWKEVWRLASSGKLDKDHYNKFMTVNGQECGMEIWKQFYELDMVHDVKKLSDVPLLNIHGEKDSRVPYTETLAYAKAREGASAVTQFIRLPNSDHYFDDDIEREEAVEATVEWFRQTL